MRLSYAHGDFASPLGRVSRQATKILRTSPSASSPQSKINRRNHAKQIQLQKRQSLLAAVRLFGGVDGAPRIVAVVPLCEDVTSRAAASALAQSLEIPPAQTDDECVWKVKFVRPIFFFFRFLARVPCPYSVSPKGGTVQNIPAVYSTSLRGLLCHSGCL